MSEDSAAGDSQQQAESEVPLNASVDSTRDEDKVWNFSLHFKNAFLNLE